MVRVERPPVSAVDRTATDDPSRSNTGRAVGASVRGVPRPEEDPVVVLPGTPGARLIGTLFDGTGCELGLRILAPDRPGFGRSTPWSGRCPTDAGVWFDLLTEASVSSAPVAAFSGGAADAPALVATPGDLVDRLGLVAAAVPLSIVRDIPRLQQALGRAAVRTFRLLAAGLRGQAWVADAGVRRSSSAST